MSGKGSAAKHAEKYKEVRNYWGDPEAAKARAEKIRAEGIPGMEPLKSDRKCRYCQAPLALVAGVDGRIVALDLTAAVYGVVHLGRDGFRAVRIGFNYVDHWATCSGAKQAKADQLKARGGADA